MKQILICISFLSIVLLSCKNNSAGKEIITVFCAASTTDVVSELADSFMNNNPVVIKLNLASSGTLARQLAMGNPANIYISANKQWADFSDSLGLFTTRKQLWQNKLVMVAPISSSTDSIRFLPGQAPEINGYLSIGDPTHVPAGRYAYEALTSLGWWDEYEGNILPAKDVRSALRMVEMGECEMGIVYYSDARVSQKVNIIGEIPDSCYTPIIMHALLEKEASELTTNFYTMLNHSLYENIWLKHGLTTAVN